MSLDGDEDIETGLPGFRTWKAVYVLVLTSFCVWVIGLLALAAHFA